MWVLPPKEEVNSVSWPSASRPLPCCIKAQQPERGEGCGEVVQVHKGVHHLGEHVYKVYKAEVEQ